MLNWLKDIFPVRIYTARAMTGVRADHLVKEAKEIRDYLYQHRMIALDPVSSEHVKKSRKKLHNGYAKLRDYWRRDKEMIESAHVVLDVTGPAKSEGVAHEMGFARYGLWKPVVRIYPGGLGPSIARLEDDIVVTDLAQAVDEIDARWGTPRKRLLWRIKILNRCLPKALWRRFVWLINWL